MSAAAGPRVVFTSRECAEFTAELRAEVAEWFVRRGHSDKANLAMVLKSFVLLGVYAGAFLLLVFAAPPGPVALALVVLLGIAMAGIGFAVAHDALHGAYSSRPWVNRLIGGSFDLLGANGYMWKLTHNVVHHTYTNIHGVDEDLDVSPLLRLSPQAPWKAMHRWQHVYAFLTYGLTTLFWVFAKDFKYFLRRDIGPLRDRRHPRAEVLWLLGSKLAYVGYALVLPLVVVPRPWWEIVGAFVLAHVIASVILGVVFQLAHVVEGTEHPLPDDVGTMEHAWVIHEMLTTSNFARTNRALSWYVGGLNFQVEHHLFPRVCSIHYPALSEVVRAVAARHGVRYNEHPTLRGAVASHYRTLRMLGRPPLVAAA